METFLSQPFGPTRYVSFLCFSCSSFFVFPSLLVFAFYFSLYLFAFLFPNQVLEEYKKRYPEEELPDFLRLNLVCWINKINFDPHRFRDHVKDNAIRTYLRAPKKAALFESKRFCKLISLNNRNYLIMSEVNKTSNSKHQTRSLRERRRQQIQCFRQRHRRCSLLLPGDHCCHLFVFDMLILIMLIILIRSQVCSSSSEHRAWLGLALYPRSRQHCRLTICRWFGWIWQIVWDNNIQISNVILRRGALSTNVLRQRQWWSFGRHCIENHIVYGCHYKLNRFLRWVVCLASSLDSVSYQVKNIK